PPDSSSEGALVTTDQADRLLAMMNLDPDALSAAAADIDADMQLLAHDATRVAERLEAAVREAGLFAADGVSALVEEARDYYWVEYGLGGDDWTAAHTLFGDDAQVDVEATGHLLDSVPAELQHRFRFQVFIERRLGD